MLITFAPWSTAQRMASASLSEPTLTPAAMGRILAFGAMPSSCISPPPLPAISEAIAVPCPPVVSGSRRPSAAPPARPYPGSTCPTRSGWVASTPLSMTATVTPCPWLLAWALEMCSAPRYHCNPRTVSAYATPGMTTRPVDIASRVAAPASAIRAVLVMPARPRLSTVEPGSCATAPGASTGAVVADRRVRLLPRLGVAHLRADVVLSGDPDGATDLVEQRVDVLHGAVPGLLVGLVGLAVLTGPVQLLQPGPQGVQLLVHRARAGLHLSVRVLQCRVVDDNAVVHRAPSPVLVTG